MDTSSYCSALFCSQSVLSWLRSFEGTTTKVAGLKMRVRSHSDVQSATEFCAHSSEADVSVNCAVASLLRSVEFNSRTKSLAMVVSSQ
jgi:hypothetical protein